MTGLGEAAASAAAQRISFDQVLGWTGDGALFRTGPALLEVVE